METSRFDFHLPPQQIAQEPLPERDASRLMVLDRAAKAWSDRHVRELPALLRPGDLLVLNDTRVIPARLRATRDSSGGKVEFLLLPPEPNGVALAALPLAASVSATHGQPTAGLPVPHVIRRVLTKSGGKLLVGETCSLPGGLRATLRERLGEAGDVVEFHCSPAEFDAHISQHGEVPLPP